MVLGVGVGGAAVIAPLYIAELAPTAVRGRCVGVNAFFIPFGQVVASALGAAFQAGVANKIGWRVLCKSMMPVSKGQTLTSEVGLGVVPSCLQLCLMHFLPESPRVLILRGQQDRAKATLQRIYKGASDEVIDFKQRVAKYWSHKPYRRAIIAVSGVQAFGQLTGFNTRYYSSTIFGLLGLKNSAAAGLIPSCLNAAFVVSNGTLE